MNFAARTGPVELPVCKPPQLLADRLVIHTKGFSNTGTGVVELSLSIKHIYKIEFLDNTEGTGAGLVFFINDFMSNTLQKKLKHSCGTVKCYIPEKFILMDVVTCDPRTIQSLHAVLSETYNYRRQYIIEKMNDPAANVAKNEPVPILDDYIKSIPFISWKALLNSMGKDVYLVGAIGSSELHVDELAQSATQVVKEHIEATTNNGQILNYTIGTICSFRPTTNVDTPPQEMPQLHPPLAPLPSNGTTITQPPENRVDDKEMEEPSEESSPQKSEPKSPQIRKLTPRQVTVAAAVIRDHTTAPNTPGRSSTAPSSGSSAPETSRLDTLRSRTVGQKREVHTVTVDSDEHESPSKKANTLVFKFPPTGRDQCAVHYSDLKCLGKGVMLNDTIIDFYLKYVLHELVPEERRSKIHLFNSFFYSKLSQIPPNARVNVKMTQTRLKRVQNNYQTVKSWTKRIDLFQMDYVVVPINEDIHWYLAIIVNPAGGIVNAKSPPPSSSSAAKSAAAASSPESAPPLLILLNSLLEPDTVQAKKDKLVLDKLCEYLQLEYNDKKVENRLPGESFEKSRIKLITPDATPQQKNYIDCGLFLLQFAELFLTSPPAISSPTEKRVSFGDWFPKFAIRGKRQAIQTLIKRLEPGVHLYNDFHPYAKKRGRSKKPTKKATTPSSSSSKSAAAAEDSEVRARRHSDSSVVESGIDFKLSPRQRSMDSLLQGGKDLPREITFRQTRSSSRRSTSTR